MRRVLLNKITAQKGKPCQRQKKNLTRFKEEVEAVNEKLRELTEEELEQVTGGFFADPNVVKLPGSSNSWV